MYYIDPVAGPRKLPTVENPRANTAYVDREAVFVVDVPRRDVTLQHNGQSTSVGSQLVYLVNEA
jgi:hypothetical protein